MNEKTQKDSPARGDDRAERRWLQFSLRSAIMVAVEFSVLVALWSTLPALQSIGHVDFWLVLLVPLWTYQLVNARPSWRGAILAMLPSVFYVFIAHLGIGTQYPDWVSELVVLVSGVIGGAVIASWIFFRLFRGWQYVLVLPVWLAILVGTTEIIGGAWEYYRLMHP
ncbi:MAG TPA: hypothetical protein DD670_01535 [Planctomycetaceae bacterium]|nr:hypothetical protein [Planctomycetaceae bacterium]